MKLTKVRIKNFQCIHDSTEFDIDDITCLVGKNESGKTAILKALHKFNPFDTAPGFEHPDDYPVEHNKVENDVVEVTFSLEQEDVDEIEKFITCKCLNADEPTITLSNGYSNTIKVVRYGFEIDTDAIISHISTEANIKLNPSITDPTKIAKDLLAKLDFSENDPRYTILKALNLSNLKDIIHNSILSPRIPKFIYIYEYQRINSIVNMNQLFNGIQNGQTQPSDQPIADILKSARVNLNHIINPATDNEYGIAVRTAEFSIDTVLNEIFKSWSQHEIYHMESEIVRANQEGDPILRVYITDSRKDKGYLTRKPFESESNGFIWFFSFLLMQKHFYTDNNDVILLLDEPGLSLHAKAQVDLLRFFEAELASRHQVIYTTHSPFMIDSNHLNHVRLVENLSLKQESNQGKYRDVGTKVYPNALKVSKGSLLPLQTTLGYDISQNIFIGRNNLIVEGASDLVYITILSSYLEKNGMRRLDPAWNIVPAGNVEKVASFVALFGANTDLNFAVLVDSHKKGWQRVENTCDEGFIDKERILTYADFTSHKEADVEDMFTQNFYLNLVSQAYSRSIKVEHLPIKHPRIIKRLEKYFEIHPLPNNDWFSHLKPAIYFRDNSASIGEIPKSILDRFQKLFDALNELVIR